MPVFSRRLCKKALFLGVNLAVQVAAARAGLLQPRPAATLGPVQEQETSHEHRTVRQPSAAVAAVRRAKRSELAKERLQSASTAVGLARLQLRIGNTPDAAATLERLHEEIQSLRQELEGVRGTPAPRRFKPQLRGDKGKDEELLTDRSCYP